MKTFAILLATIEAVCVQMHFLGINGLTLMSIPITIFLGFEVLEKLTETEEQPNK